MINKNRITQLEAAAGRINAPSDTEYNAASDHSMTRVRESIEAKLNNIGNEEYIYTQTAAETAQQAADETLIQAYNLYHNVPTDNGAFDRIIHKLDLMARRIGNE